MPSVLHIAVISAAPPSPSPTCWQLCPSVMFCVSPALRPPLRPRAQSHLPAQVLITIALSSAKISRPTVGRGIIKEWLACRLLTAILEGSYENVLEMYFFELSPRAWRVGVRAGVPPYEMELLTWSRGVYAQCTLPYHLLTGTCSVSQRSLCPCTSITLHCSSGNSRSTHHHHKRRHLGPSHRCPLHTCPLTPTQSTPTSYCVSFWAVSASPAHTSRTLMAAEHYASSAWQTHVWHRVHTIVARRVPSVPPPHAALHARVLLLPST